MAVNKGHKQINRDILVENRHYKTKNTTDFFSWLRTQNVTGRSVLNKFKSCIFVFWVFFVFVFCNFSEVRYIHTHKNGV